MQTVFMQIVVVGIFAFVGWLAYFGLAKYNSAILPLLGVVAFIVMEFTFICVSVFVKAYGVSVFSRTRGVFDGTSHANSAVKTTRIDYSLGPKNVFTGKRSIYVREREVSGGGCLLVLGVPAIVIGLTGIFKFVFETVRVLLSDERQAAWDDSRAYLTEKMNAQGKVSFFGTPIICALSVAVLVAVSTPVAIATAYRYSPDRIQIEFTEKENKLDRYGNASIYYEGSLTNKGAAKVEQVEGCLHLKSKDGETLLSKELVINVPFAIPSPPDNHLEKNESWDFAFEVYLTADNPDAAQLWDIELADTDMRFEVTSIRYKTNGSVEFSNKQIEVAIGEN